MSILDAAAPPSVGAVTVTITGDAGRGKSILAATFPEPIFIPFAGERLVLPPGFPPVKVLPTVTKSEQLWEQLQALTREDHPYKTVVIDSVTTAERMFTEEIIANDPKQPKSLQQAAGGYGAGYGILVSMHARVRKLASYLAERKGINVVFIAHADTIKIDPPNEESYTSYSLRLDKRTLPFYVDEVDVVGFLKLETTVIGEEGERKKAISDGTRVLITYATAENISKNRFGINKDLIVKIGENPLSAYVAALRTKATETKKETKE